MSRTYYMGKERAYRTTEQYHLKKAEQCIDEAKIALDAYFKDKGPAEDQWKQFKKQLDQAKSHYHEADEFKKKVEDAVRRQCRRKRDE